MVPAYFLSPAEIRLIKRMLLLRPKPTNQVILAYFTRPGRDLNHRIIAEIDSGSRGALEPPATEGEILAYMAAVANLRFPDGRDFTPQGQFYAPSGAIGQLRLHWWPVGQGLFSSGALTLK
ncbi:hypothetical protein [Rhizobium leguminosarum]|uniref:hypothetical protein n=1 Tax=Rhizobium leguminosarum TaxID=384 RepID=UPI001A91D314|nr:hypothetical protein [Rhizobium leguminosarum]QSW27344.1 hypothetical protein J0664_31485 [Rhizobium leguminosarum]